MDVLLDTNILLAPGRYKTDVFSLLAERRAGLLTLSGVVDEVKKLANGKGKDGAAARLALTLLEKNHVIVEPSRGPVDRALVAAAEGRGHTVFTMDRKLLVALKKKRLPRLTLSKGVLV